MAEPPSDLRIDWGVDLWDKNDVLQRHMKKGLDFCETLKDYFGELAAIEIEYSIKLKRLHDRCFPVKKKEDDDIKFTHVESFRHISDEVVVIANQHAEIGDKLNAEVVKDLKGYMKELKAETARLFAEADRYRKELEGYKGQLERSREHYEKAHRDTQRATELFKKTDQDVKAAKIDVEKCRVMMNSRQADEDRSKQEYAEQQQTFNKRQRDHYYQVMPVVHKGVQALEEKRILRVQETLRRVHSCHQGVISIIQKCIQNMASHTTAINPTGDLHAVVRKYESGEKPPGDVPFYDLSPSGNYAMPSTPAASYNGTSISPGSSSASLSSAGNPVRPQRGQRSGSIKAGAEDFSDQPPAQQVRRLKNRIEELEKDVEKQRKACEGLVRMLETFKTNEKGGDIHSTEKMLEETQRKHKTVQDELDKFHRYLTEAQARLASAGGGNSLDNSTLLTTPRTSNMAGGQQYQSASTPPLTPVANQLNQQMANLRHVDEFDDEFDEEPPSQPATNGNGVDGSAHCRALYDYDGSQPGTLKMEKGEVLEIVERDPSGEQWTKVRRAATNEIAFVPTQYVSVESTI